MLRCRVPGAFSLFPHLILIQMRESRFREVKQSARVTQPASPGNRISILVYRQKLPSVQQTCRLHATPKRQAALTEGAGIRTLVALEKEGGGG